MKNSVIEDMKLALIYIINEIECVENESKWVSLELMIETSIIVLSLKKNMKYK